MPAYILRYAGTNILAGFYSAPNRRELAILIDERNDPSDYECVVVPGGYGIEFYKEGRALNLVFGDVEAGEPLEDADGIYVTEDLFDCLWGERKLKWTPIL